MAKFLKIYKKAEKLFEKQHFFRLFLFIAKFEGRFYKKLQKLDDKYILYVKNDEKMQKTNI